MIVNDHIVQFGLMSSLDVQRLEVGFQDICFRDLEIHHIRRKRFERLDTFDFDLEVDIDVV